jgi:hypothetical protein
LGHLFEHGGQTLGKMIEGLALSAKQRSTLQKALATLHQEGYLGCNSLSTVFGISWEKSLKLLKNYQGYPDLNLPRTGYVFSFGQNIRTSLE